MFIGKASISKAAHDHIVEAALAHADEQGYCSEVEEFLEALGFIIPEQTKTVTLTVEVSSSGRLSSDNLGSTHEWEVFPNDGNVDVSIISAVVNK